MSRTLLRPVVICVLATTLSLPLSLSAATNGNSKAGMASKDAGQQGKPTRRRRAEGASSKKQSRAWARKNEIDKLTAKRLEKANGYLADQKFDQANAVLDKLRVRSLNAKEREKLYTLRGYVAYGQGELSAARENLAKAIDQGTLSQQQLETFRFQIGQIYLQQSNWTKAIEEFEQWFEIVREPNSVAYYLLALAYWQLDDPDSALAPASRAVSLSLEPQEGWLQLLLAIRLTRKEYREAIPVFDALIRHFPKKSYWIQLSTLHAAMGNHEESLVPLQLAYAQGLLTEDSEIRRLAQMLLYLELPIRAAGVMTKALEEKVVDADSEFFELLSNSWIMAREYDKAVMPLTQAAELAEGGRIYLRLAEVHIQRERWGEAAAALRKALGKGDLPDPGQAELLMGIAYYSQKKPEKALEWFAHAEKFPETEVEATTWLNHIKREQAASADT